MIRTKGSVNKITKQIKEGCIEAAENLGRDGNGAGGFVGYLEYLGWNHPNSFAHLLSRILPYQVNANIEKRASVTHVNIISIPSGKHLTAEEAASLTATPINFDTDYVDADQDRADQDQVAEIRGQRSNGYDLTK